MSIGREVSKISAMKGGADDFAWLTYLKALQG